MSSHFIILYLSVHFIFSLKFLFRYIRILCYHFMTEYKIYFMLPDKVFFINIGTAGMWNHLHKVIIQVVYHAFFKYCILYCLSVWIFSCFLNVARWLFLKYQYKLLKDIKMWRYDLYEIIFCFKKICRMYKRLHLCKYYDWTLL